MALGGERIRGEQREAMPIQAERDDQLEFKSHDGWFAVKLSVTEGGMTTVEFVVADSTYSEQWDARKIRTLKPLRDHIRVISEQLQDAECHNVRVTMTVCAFWKDKNDSEGEGWYDAVVTQVSPRQHTFGVNVSEEFCTCSFTVIWLNGPDKGQPGENLTCSDICLISAKEVETHPVIVDMLAQANRQGSGKIQGGGVPNHNAAKERKREKDDSSDYTASVEGKVVRQFHRLKSKATTNSTVNAEEDLVDRDPTEGSELASEISDLSACTSTRREVQDVFPEIRAAQLMQELGLSSSVAQLLGGTSGNTFNNPAPLVQSELAIDAGIQDVSLCSQSAEDNRPTKKMRGQLGKEELLSPELVTARERILGTKSLDRLSEMKVQQKKTMSPNSNPLPERRAKTRVAVDFSEDAKCNVQPMKETVKAIGDSLDGHHLRSRPSAVQVQNANVQATVGSLQDHHLRSRPREVQGKEENDKSESKADPFQERHLSSKSSGTEAKCDVILASNRAEVIPPTIDEMQTEEHCCRKKGETPPSEAHRSKKIVIFEIDYRNESFSILRGSSPNGSLAGAGLPKSPPNYKRFLGSAEKSCLEPRDKTSGPKSEAPSDHSVNVPLKPKDEDSSVKRQKGWDKRREEITGSVDGSFGGLKKDPFVQANSEEEFKVGMRLPRERSLLQKRMSRKLVDSKSDARLGSNPKSAICLSDDGEKCIIPGNTTSPGGYAGERSAGSDLFTEEQEGQNAHFLTRARSTSSFTKNVLMKKSGVIILIDNLDADVRDSDLREQLLKFCDEKKIQFVTIPPPQPQMNHAMGYVIFVDKEAADAAADVLTSFLIVSAKGKPWVVKRQGQEETYFQKTLDSKGDVMDGHPLSSGKFKVLTRKHLSEFNAAKKRLRLFEMHRKQSRLVLQEQAEEDDMMDTDYKPIF